MYNQTNSQRPKRIVQSVPQGQGDNWTSTASSWPEVRFWEEQRFKHREKSLVPSPARTPSQAVYTAWAPKTSVSLGLLWLGSCQFPPWQRLLRTSSDLTAGRSQTHPSLVAPAGHQVLLPGPPPPFAEVPTTCLPGFKVPCSLLPNASLLGPGLFRAWPLGSRQTFKPRVENRICHPSHSG